MPRRVILHVGPHKTGTTALQEALTAGTGTLLRYGIAFPKTGRATHAHHDLIEAVGREIPGVLEDFEVEIAEEDTVLISSEPLSTLHLSSLKRFATYLGNADVEVIYTLRPLSQLWPSHWREMIKHGLTDPFPVWLARPSSFDFSAFRAPPSPVAQLDRLAAVFGRDALRLQVYGADDMGVSFARDILGLPAKSASKFMTGRHNLTPADATLEVVRRANRIFKGQEPAVRRAVGYRILDILRSAPPSWFAEVQACVDAAPRLEVSERMPALATETELTVGRYGDLFDVAAWTMPQEARVPVLDALPGDLATAIEAFARETWPLP